MGFASRITGTGSAYPETRLTNDDLAAELAKIGEETSDQWIRERTGISERRIARRTGGAAPESERNSSFGFLAAQRALEMAGKRPEDVDAILYATCTPDTLIPSTACWVQQKLGAKNAWAMDLNAACSGFVFGIATADQYIRTGMIKTVLVIGGDTLSAFTNWNDRGSCILFGDAAGAIVMERTDEKSPSRVLSTHMHTDGNLWDLFFIEAGGSNQHVTPEIYGRHGDKMQMKGREIFKEAVRTLAEFGEKALQANGLSSEQLDWLIPHQANLRIIEATAKRLKFPMDKVLVNIDRFGNTSAATVPTALDEAVRDGRIRSGQTVLMDVFGAGLTYGSVLVRW